MIEGRVSEDGVPIIKVPIAGREWTATVDSGFNGDLELPELLRPHVNTTDYGPIELSLAGGQTLVEQSYLVDFIFDGESVRALATFVTGDEILIGTHLLRNHVLTIDFPAGMVRLERTAGDR